MKKALTWNKKNLLQTLTSWIISANIWKEGKPFCCLQPSPSVLCSYPYPSQTFSACPYPSSAETCLLVSRSSLFLKIYLGQVISNVEAQVHVILGCKTFVKILLRLRSFISLIELHVILGCQIFVNIFLRLQSIRSSIEVQQSNPSPWLCDKYSSSGAEGACLRLICSPTNVPGQEPVVSIPTIP